MRDKWVRYLVDCETKQPLELKTARRYGEFITRGALASVNGKRYNILGGIPRFVDEEFYVGMDEPKSDEIQTARSFGSKWRTPSMHFGMRGNEIDYEYFRRILYLILNIKDEVELKDIFKDGTNCLNAGCGVAWYEYLFNVNSKSNRFGIDISTSVESAYEFTKDFSNVCILQANIFSMPFTYDFFDVIMSDGVLHHTGDARRAFGILCNHLKPGGLIGVYVYSIKPFIRENVDKLVRDLTTSMTFDECKEFSDQMTMLGKSLSEVKGDVVISKDVPILGIKKGKYKVQEFVYKHIVKCWYNERQGHDTSVMVNVDWYHPKYATHHSKEEISQWFHENGIEDVDFRQPKEWEYSGYFVSGRKKKNG